MTDFLPLVGFAVLALGGAWLLSRLLQLGGRNDDAVHGDSLTGASSASRDPTDDFH